MMNNENQNIFSLLSLLCISICPIIPFTITDIYYSYSSYQCLDENTNFSTILNTRLWLKVNGYISLFSICFIIFVFSVIYNNKCTKIIMILQHNFFIKTYIFLKIIFNISWTILGILTFSQTYKECSDVIQIYIWIRLSVMGFLILMSLKKIKTNMFDVEYDERDLSTTHT